MLQPPILSRCEGAQPVGAEVSSEPNLLLRRCLSITVRSCFTIELFKKAYVNHFGAKLVPELGHLRL